MDHDTCVRTNASTPHEVIMKAVAANRQLQHSPVSRPLHMRHRSQLTVGGLTYVGLTCANLYGSSSGNLQLAGMPGGHELLVRQHRSQASHKYERPYFLGLHKVCRHSPVVFSPASSVGAFSKLRDGMMTCKWHSSVQLEDSSSPLDVNAVGHQTGWIPPPTSAKMAFMKSRESGSLVTRLKNQKDGSKRSGFLLSPRPLLRAKSLTIEQQS